MANYYSKEVFKERVNQLSTAIGWDLYPISSNGEYAVNGSPISFLGYYHTLKDQILYIDGILTGIKLNKH